MTDEQLEANIESIVRATCTYRNPALGPFINRAVLMTVPGNEYYALKVDQWCPTATAEQINKVGVICPPFPISASRANLNCNVV